MKSVDKRLNNIISKNIRIMLFNIVSKKTSNRVYFYIHNQTYKQLDAQMTLQIKQNISL